MNALKKQLLHLTHEANCAIVPKCFGALFLWLCYKFCDEPFISDSPSSIDAIRYVSCEEFDRLVIMKFEKF